AAGSARCGPCFGKPRLHVPAHGHDEQIRPRLEKLHGAAKRAGSYPGAARQIGESPGPRRDQRVARILALGKDETEVGRYGEGDVLRAVDGEIGATVVEGFLELFDEEALPADLRQRAVEDLVA